MSIRFGTDGVRGVANAQITAEVALAIGRATARVFRSSAIVVGRDTRRSGSMLESAVAAGISRRGRGRGAARRRAHPGGGDRLRP